MIWLILGFLALVFTTWFIWAIIYGFATGRMWIDPNLSGRALIGIWIL